MSRATVVYVGMVLVLVGGLWAVLAIGGRLVAPEDLGGRWTAVGPAGGPTGGAAAAAGDWPGVTVGQSGRYFELAFEDGPTVSASVRGTDPSGALELARGPWRVTIGPAGADGARRFRVEGPRGGSLLARRQGKGDPGAAPGKEARP